MAVYYASLAIAIMLGVAGQLVLKAAAEGGATVAAQFLNPLTALGLAIYFVAAILYIAALRKIPVVIAYPSISISYAIIAVVAHILWDEPFGWQQIAGIVLIGGGVLMLHQH